MLDDRDYMRRSPRRPENKVQTGMSCVYALIAINAAAFLLTMGSKQESVYRLWLSADGIRDSLQASLEKAAQAAAGVSQQVSTITDLGGQIRELLQVEKAMEKSLSGIAQADNFQKTLAQLREHLQNTDEFCRKISKPRVITFREEAV